MKLEFTGNNLGKYLVITAFLICSSRSYSQRMTGTEMLGRPTNSSIGIKAIFDSLVQVRVAYGTVSGTYPSHTSWQTVTQDIFGDAVAVINLTGLTASTEYFYKLQYRKPGDTANISRVEHSFNTAKNPGESFTFVIQADPHLDAGSDTALYRVCLKNQLDDNPDFMIDLGDNFMTDKLNDAITHQVPEDTIPYRCKLLRYYYQTVNHSVPLYLVLGNHEGECGWYNNGTANNMAVWDTKYRKKYYMNPLPDAFYSGDTTNYPYIGQREAYYSWTWGDALFVVLDPYWNTTPKPDSLNCWRWTLGKVQYDWLKTVLENSPSPYKFVFIHNLVGGNSEGRGGIEFAPYYEWGGQNIDGTNGWAANRPGWYKPIKDLLEENKVAVVFHGHDHFFGKQELDCLIYQEIPQPCFPNFTSANQAIKYGYTHGVIIPSAGHLRVNVSPTGVTIDYVRAARPSQETANLHNKDVSHTYNLNLNCYDTLHSSIKTLSDENFNTITVYPNPTKNILTVETEIAKDSDLQIELVSLSGVILASGKLGKGQTSLSLNISAIASGIYLVKVYNNFNSSAFKITITK